MVDAVHPESEVSRQFSVAVDQFVASSCKDGAKAAALRAQLSQWAAIDSQVQPLAQNSVLVQNAAPASAAFSQAAELALTALDRIAQGLPLPDALKKLQSDALAAFRNPGAQVSVDDSDACRVPEADRSLGHGRSLHRLQVNCRAMCAVRLPRARLATQFRGVVAGAFTGIVKRFLPLPGQTPI